MCLLEGRARRGGDIIVMDQGAIAEKGSGESGGQRGGGSYLAGRRMLSLIAEYFALNAHLPATRLRSG